jgi:ribosomal protection tetracycline resistance protein
VTAPDPGALFRALTELADQDPLIDVRRADEHGSLVVSLYGEVQREVIAARLAEEFGVVADFSPPRIICVEQLAGVGTALREIGPNPATVGLRVEPGPADSGTRFGLEVERGSLPRAFMTAIEDTVHASLRHGPHGWRVLDCTVTLTHTAYWSPSTVAGDFRYLVPLVLMAALRRAGTVVCEPLDRAELEVPADALTAVLAAITRCGGLPDVPVVRGDSCSIDAVMPVARLRDLARLLPGITGGVGVLTSRFEGYRPVSAGVDTPTPPRVVAP